MTDLEILVKQTSNSAILKMQQRLHAEVVELGKKALQWKEGCHALELALETERDAANLYAKQVAHWIEKHDEVKDSLDFYKRRVEALQQWQSKMRDPERTVVCDILANGHTLEFAGNRYTPPAAQRQWVSLTDEDKVALSEDAEGNTWMAVELSEAKLKEKNSAI